MRRPSFQRHFCPARIEIERFRVRKRESTTGSGPKATAVSTRSIEPSEHGLLIGHPFPLGVGDKGWSPPPPRDKPCCVETQPARPMRMRRRRTPARERIIALQCLDPLASLERLATIEGRIASTQRGRGGIRSPPNRSWFLGRSDGGIRFDVESGGGIWSSGPRTHPRRSPETGGPAPSAGRPPNRWRALERFRLVTTSLDRQE